MGTQQREYDIILWGASGFTGRLTAEYLLSTYGVGKELRWALGGRNEGKLQELRAKLAKLGKHGASAAELPIVVGDSDDEAFLGEMVQRATVVCSTVGPYAKYGRKLVAACAAHGTHYCDLTGEPHFMRQMIDAHGDAAKHSGARIVFTCGFDCIPSDLGTLFVQDAMRQRHGVAAASVRFRVAGMRGGASGGTIASMLNVLEDVARDPSVLEVMDEPYSLNPQGMREGPDLPERDTGWYDEAFRQWVMPFVMGAVNTKVVRRSNALLDYAWGQDFRYDEGVLSGEGPRGWLKSAVTAGATAMGRRAMDFGPVRGLVGGKAPQPGTGPSREAREAGFFKIMLWAEHPEDPDKSLRARVTGDRDPGYGSTSKMLAESAVCLAKDALSVGGGMWTPASAMGTTLIERLRAKAGLTFELID